MSNNPYPRVFSTSSPVNLSVKTQAGRVNVVAADVTESTVHLKPAKDGDPEAMEAIERAFVDLQGDAIRIEVSRRSAGPSLLREPAVDVQVTVPFGSTVSAKCGSADAFLAGGLSDVSVTAGSGRVSVEDCAKASLKTGSGDIHVRNAANVDVHSGSGDVTVEKPSGDVEASTGSGDLHADRLIGHADVRTASGDVELGETLATVKVKTASGTARIRRAVNGAIEVTSASGAVTIGVVSGTAAKLDCSSVSGTLLSELDPTSTPGEFDQTVAITARTVSGFITIVRAKPPSRHQETDDVLPS